MGVNAVLDVPTAGGKAIPSLQGKQLIALSGGGALHACFGLKCKKPAPGGAGFSKVDFVSNYSLRFFATPCCKAKSRQSGNQERNGAWDRNIGNGADVELRIHITEHNARCSSEGASFCHRYSCGH